MVVLDTEECKSTDRPTDRSDRKRQANCASNLYMKPFYYLFGQLNLSQSLVPLKMSWRPA